MLFSGKRSSLVRLALALRSLSPGLGLCFGLCFGLTLAALVSPALGQTYQAVEQGEVPSLPHAMTPDEQAIRDQIGIQHRTSPPPSAQPVRNIAEFERMRGVLIRYPLGISTAIVAEMSEDVIVYCIVTASQQQTAYNTFAAAGVNMANVVFFNAATDSYWTRDYGPWFIFDAGGELGVVDVIYNRPRPNDDVIPATFGAFLGLPVYGPDLIHTGGNWMTDGHGTAISTTLVYEENPGKTVAEIEAIVHDYLGIETYYCYPDVNGEYIEHIDCWAKYLAPDKILIRRVPASHTQYDEIEAAVAYFAAQTSAYGTPYQIFRVDTPGNEPYTNSLILNDKALVPIMGGSHPDAAAIAAYQAAMPGYEVLGFTGSWASTDALHCRAKGVGDPSYLYVYSIPLRDTANDEEPYAVAAEIIAHSEAGLIPGDLRVYWRNGTGGPWTAAGMAAIAGTDSFYTDIPAQPLGSIVQYYVHAADASGRQEDWPLVGPAGPFSFAVAPDTQAPFISGTTELPWTDDTTGPYPVSCTVTDDMELDSVFLCYAVGGGSTQTLAMDRVGASLYCAAIPGQDYPSRVEYYIRAEDFGGNVAFDPPSAPTTPYEFWVLLKTIALEDGFESGSAWTHGAVTAGFGDQWHLSTQRNHTPGGTTSWKCGMAGAGTYATLLDAGLVSEPVTLTTESALTFWQYVAAESSSTYPGYAYDGALVEIDTGSGWQAIAPDGGYPFRIRGTAGPFTPETGVFSGHRGWHEVRFALGAFSGSARIRLRFGSDTAVGDEGWYVDDVRIDGFVLDLQAVEPAPWTAAGELRLVCGPNPIATRAVLSFDLAHATPVRVGVYDPAGRLVRTLADVKLPAGTHHVMWDRSDDRGRPVSSGIYFSKLQAGERSAVTRLVVLE